MVFLTAGASHTGKTALAQRTLEKYGYPYLPLDHLKMGLIRSRNTTLAPMSDDNALTDYFVREIIKTVIENQQNLIIKGCYIPFDWAKDFEADHLRHIKYRCLVMSKSYIQHHYHEIQTYADTIEKRPDDSCFTMEAKKICQKYGVDYLLIDNTYPLEIDI